jgi:hypothetical protein
MLSIEERLRDLPGPVALVYYTPDVPSAATRAERQLLEDIAKRSDRVELRVLAERWDAEREAQVAIARTPAIVPLGSGRSLRRAPAPLTSPLHLEVLHAPT